MSGRACFQGRVDIEAGIVWFFSSLGPCLAGYDQLYRQYTRKPLNMAPVSLGSGGHLDIGTHRLRMVSSHVKHELISAQAATFSSMNSCLLIEIIINCQLSLTIIPYFT